jgi:NADPH-dependent 2,4-dienoyl-CoA reductase/sulfur reductase-like enzyme
MESTVEKADVIVIGAGPAGLTAATTIASHGLSCILFDEANDPGGQIYRSAKNLGDGRRPSSDADLSRGKKLIDDARLSSADLRFGSMVWDIAANNVVTVSTAGRSRQVRAACLVLATGAMERPVPIAGWTLPGVMTAGAAQTAFKSAGLVPRKKVILAGCGPLLWLTGSQLLDAGAQIAAVVTTSGAAQRYAALRHVAGAIRHADRIAQGVLWIAKLRSAGVAMHSAIQAMEVIGHARAEGLRLASQHGEMELQADLILLHAGVMPNILITRALGCQHQWDPLQLAWRPLRDRWGRTSLETCFVVGDAGGVDGARAAEIQGRLAALRIASDLGRLAVGERNTLAAPLWTRLHAERCLRPFLDTLYRPPDWLTAPVRADIIVCRCEEVTVGEVQGLATRGVTGVSQMKSYTRCGMGPCRGRLCGPTVCAILAKTRGVSPAEIEPFRERPPFKPIPIRELAELEV